MSSQLILVDGSALVYRAHYAFAGRPLTAPSGETTSVAFGVVNAVLKLIEDYRPSHLAMVFDRKGPTFRNEIYPRYKANRKPMPDELAEQLPRLHEVLASWRLPVLELDRYEADDIMGTMARRSRGVCDQVWFYTGDKDFQQLLDERTGILKPGRRGDELSEFTLDDLRREWRLEPEQIIDCFALAGDKSDNIPGAPGVGDKTALKLIQRYGDLETLYAELEASDLSPRLRRVLAENREQVFLSRRLFRIATDVPVEADWDALRTVLPQDPATAALMDRLGLQRALRRAERLAAGAVRPRPRPVAAESRPPTAGAAESPPPAAASTPPLPPSSPAAGAGEPQTGSQAAGAYTLLVDVEALAAWLRDLPPDAALAIDTETDDLVVHRARLVGVSLATAGRPAAYVPILWREAQAAEAQAGEATLFAQGAEREQLAAVRACLADALGDPRRLKVGQNLKFDLWILERHGFVVRGPFFDTMLASYVLDPGRRSHGLDELARVYLQRTVIGYGDLFGRGDRRRDILAVPIERLAEYAAEDADVALQLHAALADRLAENESLARIFADVEMPLMQVLLRMEQAGIKIDRSFLGELEQAFASELTRLETQIYELAGETFNVQSPKQLQSVLFERLKLRPSKKTSTGWSTDVTVLEQLADQHELPRLVLEHRQVAKLQGTYVRALPELAAPGDLIHTSFNQAVAATGRLSSSDPNLQNIPVRTELGRRIRRAFVPRRASHLFLSADYSQIELRLLAHLAQDAALRAAFREGADVHRRTAALIAGVREDAVTDEMRARAKAVNFGVIYGMGARSLARQIQVRVAEAQDFIDRYFATYPGVRAFIEQTRSQARRDGHVQTMLGRRRWLPDIGSDNPRLRSLQERIAVNTPIQGAAADLIKLAMIAIDKALREQGGAAMLLLQVHDELVLEVPRDEIAATSDLVRRCMETAMELSVPLVVTMHTGGDWREAHG